MRTGDVSLERAVILVDLGSHFAPFLGGWRPIHFTYGKGPVFSRRFYRCVLERRLLSHYKLVIGWDEQMGSVRPQCGF